jgi:Uma2 family endonuclease
MTQIIEALKPYEAKIIGFPNLNDLPEEDGEPLETNWHRAQINLLIDVVTTRWRDRQDFFVGGNLFIYYSPEQVLNRDYKGPGFFVVKGVDGSYSRNKWVAWIEGGKLPNVIVELLSPSTASEDLGRKKDLYERTFRTPNYFCYDPDEDYLWGWRLVGQRYVPVESDDQGRLWSTELDAWIGTWEGRYLQHQALWLRLFDAEGRLIPTGEEAERQRAEAERQRAEAAEAELARLRAELEQRKEK